MSTSVFDNTYFMAEFDPMNVSSTQKESRLSFLIHPYSMFIQNFLKSTSSFKLFS